MIYTFYEQIQMIFYFMILGIYLFIMMDTINTIFYKIKVLNYILQFISWIIIDIICIKAIDTISNGYVPIYIILFFALGCLIYKKYLKEKYIKTLLKILKNKRNILLALFPITMYNYFILKIKKLLTKRKHKNEENTINNTIISNDDDNARMQ